MAEATLCAGGSQIVTRETLSLLPTPMVMGDRHQPIPHIEFIETLDDCLKTYGLEIAREEHAIQDGGNQHFGIFDLRWKGQNPEDRGMAMGMRGSNSQKMSRQIAVGDRVFVCDNLIFGGELIAMKRKHTTGVNLREEIDTGVGRYIENHREFKAWTDRMAAAEITDAQAKAKAYDLFTTGVLPQRLMPDVHKAYFRTPEAWTDCQPRTLMGLHNACTRSVQRLKPAPKFDATIELGVAFSLN